MVLLLECDTICFLIAFCAYLQPSLMSSSCSTWALFVRCCSLCYPGSMLGRRLTMKQMASKAPIRQTAVSNMTMQSRDIKRVMSLTMADD